MEGVIEGVPLFEQICVLKEVDLHYKWSPFCSSSRTVADLDKLDTIGWFLIGLPHVGIARDGCFRAIGCDNIAEDGSILLAGQGVRDIMPGAPPPDDTFLSEDPALDDLDIPSIPTRRGSGRMTIRKFEAVIHVLSPTSARTRIVANLNPNMAFLPQPLLEFVMKHLAGVLLAKLQGATKKIIRNPVTNEHARKMREQKTFYKQWLMQKFKAICDEKGWEMPPVTAFELTMDEQRKEDQIMQRRAQGKVTFEVEDGAGNGLDLSSRHSQGSGDGSVSELSSRSGLSRWSSNPISNYMREMENKTQRAKAQKIARARRIAADRLIPKDLPAYKKDRLSELKAAKARRKSPNPNTSLPPTKAMERSIAQDSRSLSHRITLSFHNHGSAVRVLFMTALVSLLFVLLHPKLFPKYFSFHDMEVNSWRNAIVRDSFSTFHLILATAVHFLVCDISLVYAFGSLELGAKAGDQIKEFYSDNVRFGVAIMSFGAFLLSIMLSWSKVWLRLSVKTFLNGSDAFLAWIVGLVSVLPDFLLRGYEFFDTTTGSVVAVLRSTMGALVFHPIMFCWRLLTETNFLGRVLNRSLSAVFAKTILIVGKPFRSLQSLVAARGEPSDIVPWSEESFDTARTLFSYSAVFLLTILLLFTLAAPDAGTSSEDDEPLDGVETTLSKHDLWSNKMEVSQAAIPEDNEVHHGALLRDRTMTEPSVTTSSAGSGRRGLRFRRRRKSSSTGNLPSEKVSEPKDLERVDTF